MYLSTIFLHLLYTSIVFFFFYQQLFFIKKNTSLGFRNLIYIITVTLIKLICN